MSGLHSLLSRRAATTGRPRVRDAIVLSGGGSLGAAQVGALRALLESGVRPDLVVGCSVGALNAAFLAMDPTPGRVDELEAVWRKLDRADVFGPARRLASHALQVPLPAKARFYRNVDMEWSYLLRDAGVGRLVVPTGDLPVRQDRHRGYHDSDPAHRDKESKRTYDRFLSRFRGRDDLRLR